jgi:hypothetical protein
VPRPLAGQVRRPGGVLRLYNKGAAEWVLSSAARMLDERGEAVAMGEEARGALIQVGGPAAPSVWGGWGTGAGFAHVLLGENLSRRS